MIDFDPPYVTTTENFFGWDHDRMYEAAQSIDGSRIGEVAEAYKDIAALIPFGLGVAFLTSTIHQHWEGKAADRALESVEWLGVRGVEFSESIAAIAVKLHRLHADVDSIKMAVPPPERSDVASLSASRHQAAEEAREDARQAAALALTNLYTPAYRAAGTRVPVFPAPHRTGAIPPEGGPPTVPTGLSPAMGMPEAVEIPKAEAPADPADTAIFTATATPRDSAPTSAGPGGSPSDESTRPAAAGTAPARSVPAAAQPVHPSVHHVLHSTTSTSPTVSPTSNVGSSAASSDYSAIPLRRTPAADTRPPSSHATPAVRSATTRSTTADPRMPRQSPTVAERSSVIVPRAVAAGAGQESAVAVSQSGSLRPVAGPSGHLMAPGMRGTGGDAATEHKTPSYLVNMDNGNDLIGKIDPVGPAVIG